MVIPQDYPARPRRRPNTSRWGGLSDDILKATSKPPSYSTKRLPVSPKYKQTLPKATRALLRGTGNGDQLADADPKYDDTDSTIKRSTISDQRTPPSKLRRRKSYLSSDSSQSSPRRRRLNLSCSPVLLKNDGSSLGSVSTATLRRQTSFFGVSRRKRLTKKPDFVPWQTEEASQHDLLTQYFLPATPANSLCTPVSSNLNTPGPGTPTTIFHKAAPLLPRRKTLSDSMTTHPPQDDEETTNVAKGGQQCWKHSVQVQSQGDSSFPSSPCKSSLTQAIPQSRNYVNDTSELQSLEQSGQEQRVPNEVNRTAALISSSKNVPDGSSPKRVEERGVSADIGLWRAAQLCGREQEHCKGDGMATEQTANQTEVTTQRVCAASGNSYVAQQPQPMTSCFQQLNDSNISPILNRYLISQQENRSDNYFYNKKMNSCSCHSGLCKQELSEALRKIRVQSNVCRRENELSTDETGESCNGNDQVASERSLTQVSINTVVATNNEDMRNSEHSKEPVTTDSGFNDYSSGDQSHGAGNHLANVEEKGYCGSEFSYRRENVFGQLLLEIGEQLNEDRTKQPLIHHQKELVRIWQAMVNIFCTDTIENQQCVQPNADDQKNILESKRCAGIDTLDPLMLLIQTQMQKNSCSCKHDCCQAQSPQHNDAKLQLLLYLLNEQLKQRRVNLNCRLQQQQLKPRASLCSQQIQHHLQQPYCEPQQQPQQYMSCYLQHQHDHQHPGHVNDGDEGQVQLEWVQDTEERGRKHEQSHDFPEPQFEQQSQDGAREQGSFKEVTQTKEKPPKHQLGHAQSSKPHQQDTQQQIHNDKGQQQQQQQQQQQPQQQQQQQPQQHQQQQQQQQKQEQQQQKQQQQQQQQQQQKQQRQQQQQLQQHNQPQKQQQHRQQHQLRQLQNKQNWKRQQRSLSNSPKRQQHTKSTEISAIVTKMSNPEMKHIQTTPIRTRCASERLKTIFPGASMAVSARSLSTAGREISSTCFKSMPPAGEVSVTYDTSRWFHNASLESQFQEIDRTISSWPVSTVTPVTSQTRPASPFSDSSCWSLGDISLPRSEYLGRCNSDCSDIPHGEQSASVIHTKGCLRKVEDVSINKENRSHTLAKYSSWQAMSGNSLVERLLTHDKDILPRERLGLTVKRKSKYVSYCAHKTVFLLCCIVVFTMISLMSVIITYSTLK